MNADPRRSNIWFSLLFWLALATSAPCYTAEPADPQRFTNSLGMEMVLVSAGEFMMGSDESAASVREALGMKAERPNDDERPVHRVRITKAFYLGKYEVAVAEFRQFVDATAFKTDAERDGVGGVGWNGTTFGRDPKFTWSTWWNEQTDRHPAVNVSPNDAVAFCEWLSKMEGTKYRLPTEAEWEYACRAGTTTRFYTGDDAVAAAKAGNFADPRTQKPGMVLTTPVGRFVPNAFGLYDMHGNVWEWCADAYRADYYANSPVDDPQGPGGAGSVVLRGSCWGFPISTGRSAARGRSTRTGRGYRDGFRVVREN
jgi:formylglycine-generating enzyme required for sulfatase activity